MDKKILIWLDDLRNPFDNGMAWAKLFSPVKIDSTLEVIWLKNYTELKEWIEEHGIPYAICFDHDLGDFVNGKEKNGYDCARLIGEYCIKNNISIPLYAIQSSNPAGKKNIDLYLKNFQKFICSIKHDNKSKHKNKWKKRF